jgi:hypothetical protein
MPRINVAKVLSNPLFQQTFIVHRKSVAWVAGRAIITEVPLTFKGVVQNASSKQLFQVPEADRISGIMVFLSKKEMYTTTVFSDTEQYISDELEFRGRKYRVNLVNDWSNFGYFRAMAEYMEGD